MRYKSVVAIFHPTWQLFDKWQIQIGIFHFEMILLSEDMVDFVN